MGGACQQIHLQQLRAALHPGSLEHAIVHLVPHHHHPEADENAAENLDDLVTSGMSHVMSSWQSRHETNKKPFVITETEKKAVLNQGNNVNRSQEVTGHFLERFLDLSIT
ncbi:uncharacterized protein LOC124148777 [Haliotis rufescens]|uniref:uncharacterized protein LOC124148777 n=1 Tax=Haliotis rufescens TaxID=6454 RepID=UPI00201EB41E|nr:uncharacterized protein LOC124148777 [Haliotis rufescens]